MILDEAIELGGDEGLELVKVLVLRAGEAGNSWNDQPWFFTQVLRVALDLIGDHIWVPRFLVALMALAMLCAAGYIVFGKLKFLIVLPLIGFWLMSPDILDLNLSAMVEVPAFALMTMAIALAKLGSESRRLLPLLASGILAGIACQTKLVAALFLPALVVVVIVGSLMPGRLATCPTPEFSWVSRRWRSVRNICWVGGFAGLAFGLVLIFSPSWSWDQLWVNHVKASASNAVITDHNYEFTWRYLLYHEESLVGIILGVVCLALNRQWAALSGFAAMYGVSLLIHLNHKPFWYYYYVHLAVPASALSAYGLVSCMGVIIGGGRGLVRQRWAIAAAGSVMGAALLLTSSGIFGVPRFWEQWQALQTAERLKDSPLMKAIRDHSHERFTMFTRRPILYFHSRLVPIPDLALLVKKRFWSGELSEQSVVTKLIQGSPDLLHLDRRHYPSTSPINPFLQERYTMVWNQEFEEVWVRKPGANAYPQRDP